MARPCHGPDVRRYGPLGCRPGRCRGQDGPGHGHVNPARPRPGRPRRGRDVRRPRPARIRPMAPPPRTRPGRRRGIPIDCVTPRRPRPLPARSRRTPRHPRGAGTLDLFCRHTGPESKQAKTTAAILKRFCARKRVGFLPKAKTPKGNKTVELTKRFQTTRKGSPSCVLEQVSKYGNVDVFSSERAAAMRSESSRTAVKNGTVNDLHEVTSVMS